MYCESCLIFREIVSILIFMMILKTLDLFTDYNLKTKEFTGVTKTVGERKDNLENN